MLEVLPVVFLTGFLNRIADMVADDGMKLNMNVAYIAGILYGFLIAYTITHYPLLAPLGLAVVLSVLMTGKIDHPVHYLGISSMLFFSAFFGFFRTDMAVLVFFIAAAAIDEIGNGLSDRKRIRGIAGEFFRLRLTLDAAAFFISLASGSWIIFLSIIAYDLGFTYIFTRGVRSRLINITRQGFRL